MSPVKAPVQPVIDLEAQPVAPPVESPAEQALAPRTSEAVSMFERLATDPSVDVDKLQKLIEMNERLMANQARAEFYAAFAAMQGEIPEITEKGEIRVEGALRSKFARNEDIQKIVKPILQRHGFALSFRNEWTDGKYLKVIGILSHRSGHSERDEFVALADTTGSKNAIQALGSTRSYGQRYTTIALLNIATREDDDGHSSEDHKKPEAPAGYDAWLAALEGVADEGIAKLTDVFNKSKDEHKRYLLKHFARDWAALKNKAQKGGK